MNLSDVADEVATRLDTIAGLNAFAYPPGSLTPPAAVVLNPRDGDIRYDQTYRRGMDRMTLPVIVIAGRADERSANQTIRQFCDGSGASSVKAVLESGAYTSLHTLVVVTGGIDGVTWNGVEYLAALFDIDITGSGS